MLKKNSCKYYARSKTQSDRTKEIPSGFLGGLGGLVFTGLGFGWLKDHFKNLHISNIVDSPWWSLPASIWRTSTNASWRSNTTSISSPPTTSIYSTSSTSTSSSASSETSSESSSSPIFTECFQHMDFEILKTYLFYRIGSKTNPVIMGERFIILCCFVWTWESLEEVMDLRTISIMKKTKTAIFIENKGQIFYDYNTILRLFYCTMIQINNQLVKILFPRTCSIFSPLL